MALAASLMMALAAAAAAPRSACAASTTPPAAQMSAATEGPVAGFELPLPWNNSSQSASLSLSADDDWLSRLTRDQSKSSPSSLNQSQKPAAKVHDTAHALPGPRDKLSTAMCPRYDRPGPSVETACRATCRSTFTENNVIYSGCAKSF